MHDRAVPRVVASLLTTVLATVGVLVAAVPAHATVGTITEYPVPTANEQPGGSALFGVTVGADRNVWFIEKNGIGKIAPSGTVTEFPLASSLRSLRDRVGA